MALGALHLLRCLGVAVQGGIALQGGQGEPVAQLLRGLRLGQQGFLRRLVTAVKAPLPAFGVNFYLGLRTRAMVVEIGVEVLGIEAV